MRSGRFGSVVVLASLLATGCNALGVRSHWISDGRPLPTDEDPPETWTGSLSLVVGANGRHPDYAEGSLAHVRVRDRVGRVWFEGPIPYNVHAIHLRLPRDLYEVKVDEHVCAGNCGRPTPSRSWCAVNVNVGDRQPTELYAELRGAQEDCTLREYHRSTQFPAGVARVLVSRDHVAPDDEPREVGAWRVCLGQRCQADTESDLPSLDYRVPASVAAVELLAGSGTAWRVHTAGLPSRGTDNRARTCGVFSAQHGCHGHAPAETTPCTSELEIEGSTPVEVRHQVIRDGGALRCAPSAG